MRILIKQNLGSHLTCATGWGRVGPRHGCHLKLVQYDIMLPLHTGSVNKYIKIERDRATDRTKLTCYIVRVAVHARYETLCVTVAVLAGIRLLLRIALKWRLVW